MIGIMSRGAVTSLEVFFLTLLFSLPLALPVAFGRMSKNRPLHSIVSFYVLIMRGTPLILQIIFIYFAPKYLLRFLEDTLGAFISSPAFWSAVRTVLSYNRFTAVIIAFALNYAAYFAEIYRGGIESIPRGQHEAAKVLGFTRGQTFTRIVGNEVITLVKDTALARVVMVVEILREAEFFAARGLIWPLFYTGVFYLLFVGILTLLFGYAEKKLEYFRT